MNVGLWENCKFKYIASTIIIIFGVLCFPEKLYVNNSEKSSVATTIAQEKQLSHSLSATLYDTNEYDKGGSGSALTSSGVTIKNWEESKAKYLQINIKIHEASEKGHTVRVELPKEFYVESGITDVPAGFSNVEFKENPDFICNGNANHFDVNDKSGILTYYVKPNIEKATIQLAIRYDRRLWDKKSGSSITEKGVAPIKVSLNYEEKLGTYDKDGELNAVKVAAVYSGVGTTNQAYMVASSENYDLRTNNTKDCDIAILDVTNAIETICMQEGYIEIKIPYYVKNGKKYYLSYDVNKMSIVKETFRGAVSYEIVESSASTLRLKVDKMYFNLRYLCMLPLTYPSNLKISEDYAVFTGGRLKVYGTGNNGNSVTILDGEFLDLKYPTKLKEDVRGKVIGAKLVYEQIKTGVNVLGNFYLENLGTIDSVPKTITINVPNNALVTTVNLPSEGKAKTHVIEYELYDENNQQVYLDASGKKVTRTTRGAVSKWTIEVDNKTYGTTLINNISHKFSRSDLPKEHRMYYFKTIKYTVKTLKAGGLYYRQWGEYYNIGTGNIYGYPGKNARNGSVINITTYVDSEKGSGIARLTLQSKLTMTTDSKSAYGIDSTRFSEKKIFAGQDVKLSGSLFAAEYMYGTTVRMKDLVVGVLLPTSVTIDKSSVLITNRNGDNIGVKSITSKNAGGGNVIWIIEAKAATIGYSSEDLNTIETGDRFNFEMVLNTRKISNLITLNAYNIFSATSLRTTNEAYGNMGWTRKQDIYDLNKNGSTSDYIGGVNVTNQVTCIIDPKTPDIEASDKIEVIGKGTVSGKRAIIKSKGDEIVYTLNLRGLANNADSSYEGYIPIPKVSSAIDTKLVTDGSKLFNLELLKEIDVEGTSLDSIEYCIKENVDYEDAKNLSDSNWMTSEELIGEGHTHADVTLIRFKLNKGSITSSLLSNIRVTMRCVTEDIENYINSINCWRSSGYYAFKNSSNEIAGWISTDGCEATVSEEILLNEITANIENGDTFYSYEQDAKICRKDEIIIKTECYDDIEVSMCVNEMLGDNTLKRLDANSIVVYDENDKAINCEKGAYKIIANKTYKICLEDSYIKSFTKGSKRLKIIINVEDVTTEMSCSYIRRAVFVEY